MTNTDVRILFNHKPVFLLGPLGYWRVGDEVLLNELDDLLVVVTRIEMDGGAVAVEHGEIDRYAFAHNISFEEALQTRGNYYFWRGTTASVTPRQHDQCIAIRNAGGRARMAAEGGSWTPEVA